MWVGDEHEWDEKKKKFTTENQPTSSDGNNPSRDNKIRIKKITKMLAVA